MKPWTLHELRYLEEHAGDGAREIAKALCRTEQSVRVQACRMGLSLRYRRVCPKCGQLTSRRLSPSTGWCACCTKEARMAEIANDVAALEEEAARDARANKERQRLYNRRYLAKKKISSNEIKNETLPDQGKQ